MTSQINYISTEELINIYRNRDSEVKNRLLAGEPWQEVKGTIDDLIDIAKELSRRNVEIRNTSRTPADSQFR